MTNKILVVDDEPTVLKLLHSQISKRFEVTTAENGEEALQILKREGPFAVILSDMRMPGMNGVELLGKVKETYPDTVRMVLTGFTDQDTAVEAVNVGNIFRFLTKPCPSSELIAALELGEKHYQLITREKDLLKKTLKGSILVLSELLSISNPLAFGSTMRCKVYVTKIASKLKLPDLWQYEIAALLSHIGCITIPHNILTKIYYNHPLDDDEKKLYAKHPARGAKLIEKIPRLEDVTRMVALQRKRFDRYDADIINRESVEVLLGAQILKTVTDLDLYMFHGSSRKEALALLQKDEGAHNPQVVRLLEAIEVNNKEHIVTLDVKDLAVGMVVAEDVAADSGEIIISRGQPVSASTMQFFKLVGLMGRVKVNLGLVDNA